MIHNIAQDENQIQVFKANDDSKIFVFSELSGSTNDDKATDLETKIQNYLDDRISLSDLPDDDPDKTINPNQPEIFWDNNDLLSRNSVVSVRVINGSFEIKIGNI